MSRSSSRTPTLARSSSIMFGGTLVSRVLGLIRNALLVAALGATGSGAADAWTTAHNAPQMLYNLLAAGILNAILVPQIVRALRHDNGDEFVNRLLTAAGTILFGATVVLTVGAPLVITIYASQLDAWRPLAIIFALWCLPQIFFYGLYALWGQVLNARSSFGPYMWSPVLNNVISIASLLVYLHLYGAYTTTQSPDEWTAGRIALLGATSTLGIAAQALVLYIPLRRTGFKPKLVWGVRGTGLGKVSKVAMWALLGLFAAEFGSLATYNLGAAALTASELPQYAGVVVPSTIMFTNAQMIYMLPQSLVTTSIIVALFTRMSESAAANDAEGVRDSLSLGLRSIAVFTVLFAAGIGVLAEPALQVFVPSLTWEEAHASALMLTVMAIAIVPQGIWSTSQRVMLAYEDTKNLLWADVPVGIVPVVVCGLAYLLAPANHWMMWAAVGSLLSQITGAVIIMFLLRRHLPDVDGPRVFGAYLRLIACAIPAVITGVALKWALGPANELTRSERFSHAVMTVMVVAVAMTATYLIASRLLKVPELGVFVRPIVGILHKIASLLPTGPARAIERFALWVGGPHIARVTSSHDDEDDYDDDTWTPLPAGLSDPSASAAGAEPAAFAPAAGAGTMADIDAMTDGVERAHSQHHSLSSHPLSSPSSSVTGTMRSNTIAHLERSTMSSSLSASQSRYVLGQAMPTTIPTLVRHDAHDTILDRDVTMVILTDATNNPEEVLNAAARTSLCDDPRLVRIVDVQREGEHPFIVCEKFQGHTFESLVHQGLSIDEVRSIIGESAEALEHASRRGVHHLMLTPESIRVDDQGKVHVAGVGLGAALLDRPAHDRDPLSDDRVDAEALIRLLYYGVTGRWPGKRPGVPSAPLRDGVPVPPSVINSAVPDDIDQLCIEAFSHQPARSAGQVARRLAPWPVLSPRTQVNSAPTADDSSLGLFDDFASQSSPSPVVPSPGTAVGAHALWDSNSSISDTDPSIAVSANHPHSDELSDSTARVTSVPGSVLAVGDDDINSSLDNTSRHRGEVPPPPPPPSGNPEVEHYSSAETVSVSESHTSDVEDEPVASGDEDAISRRISHTTTAILVGLLIAVLVGVFFAVSNLLELAGVRVTNDDIPAAHTVPTVVATTQEPADNSGPAPKPEQSSTPISIAEVTSLDPYGNNGEHPELAHLVADGDQSTQWYSRYYAAPSLAYKGGIGLALNLTEPHEVSSIEMTGTGSGGNVQIRATTANDPEGGTLLAEGPFTPGTTTFTFTPTTTQSVVIWVTDLPTSADDLYKVTMTTVTLH
ncbi:murein biosynthesis integral membrane protein MurJ [Actinomyces vulturis]|uniref:murein biosynthesis integral membrane protein MurJ n=1 Tax=Actinomyces vulturis TaxID=1857645 RepID=UPI00083545FB|nr:murein biosynthesis integral membrane protein MurJ [Actinomyces vulturis]